MRDWFGSPSHPQTNIPVPASSLVDSPRMIYHKCRDRLMGKIGFLYRMMRELKSRGYDVVVVGKALDDLHVYIAGRIKQGEKKIFYRGFFLKVFDNFNDVEWFGRMN